MKKVLLPLLILFWGISYALADNYKVLFVNDTHLRFVKSINHGKKVERGDLFSDVKDILWEQEKQAVKVINTKTMKQSLLVGKYWVKKSGIDALIHERHLSTHKKNDESAQDTLSYENLPFIFDEEYDLLDSIEINANAILPSTGYFRATYEYNDTIITKKLASEENTIVIDTTLFNVDGECIEPRDIIVSIDFVDTEKGITIFVKDNISINVYPAKLE